MIATSLVTIFRLTVTEAEVLVGTLVVVVLMFVRSGRDVIMLSVEVVIIVVRFILVVPLAVVVTLGGN